MIDGRMRAACYFLVVGTLILGSTFCLDCKKKNQPPGVPAIPTGSTSASAGDSCRYLTTAEDPDGDSLAIRFGWGDGTMSGWSPLTRTGDSVSMLHSWSSPDTYRVEAQAKDEFGNMSGWSQSLSVIVDSNHAPDDPDAPSGPSTGAIDTTYSFSASTTDPDGDRVKYRFDWGDGLQEWTGLGASGAQVQMAHAWTSVNTYDVKVMAQDEHGSTSSWSVAHSIVIGISNPPNTPSTPSGPDSGMTSTQYSFSSSATDPDGDQVAVRFDWGDGDTSAWSSFVNGGTAVSMSHAWSTSGNYSVKAQAKDVHSATSGWSGGHQISVTSGGGSYPDSVVAWVGGFHPEGVAALPNGSYVYFANYSDGSVSVIRTSDNSPVDIIPVGVSPVGVAALPNGSYVYVTNSDPYSNSVSVIRTSDNTVVAEVPVDGAPEGIAALPNGNYVYVSTGAVIRTSDNTVVATVPVGSRPRGVAALPNGSYVYVANYDDSSVSVIRTSDNTVVATVPVNPEPIGVAALPNGSYVYVTSQENAVSVIRTSDNTVVARVGLWGGKPYGVAALPNGRYVYVTTNDDDYNKVYVIGFRSLGFPKLNRGFKER